MNIYFIFLNSWVQKKTVVIDIDNEDDATGDLLPMENKGRGSLVQATISTLFKKVEEKVSF